MASKPGSGGPAKRKGVFRVPGLKKCGGFSGWPGFLGVLIDSLSEAVWARQWVGRQWQGFPRRRSAGFSGPASPERTEQWRASVCCPVIRIFRRGTAGNNSASNRRRERSFQCSARRNRSRALHDSRDFWSAGAATHAGPGLASRRKSRTSTSLAVRTAKENTFSSSGRNRRPRAGCALLFSGKTGEITEEVLNPG